MVVPIISLVLGVLCLATPVPVVLPVIGLGLAMVGILKESKKATKRKSVLIVSSIAVLMNGFVTLMFLVGPVLGLSAR